MFRIIVSIHILAAFSYACLLDGSLGAFLFGGVIVGAMCKAWILNGEAAAKERKQKKTAAEYAQIFGKM